jgi:hypothetical protein
MAELVSCKKDAQPATPDAGQGRDAVVNDTAAGAPDGPGGSGVGGSGTGGVGGNGGNGGAGGKGGNGGTTADAAPDVGNVGRGGGGGAGTGGSSSSDARTDAVSASGCDPVHPQNPRSPLFACPTGTGCISAPDGASKCSVGGTGTETTSCTKASDCAPGYFCPTSAGATCGRFCFDDEDCPGGTCSHSFGTDQYAGPHQVGSCRPCAAGLVGCKGSCLSVKSDPNNCGSCGHACSDGQTCCGGVCVAQASLGACGCGGTATDGDGDGVPDCNDICPSNAAVSHAGTVTYSVTFTEAAQAYSERFADIKRCVDYAGKEWSKHFPVPQDVSIEVLVDVADLSANNILARCGSTSSVFVKAQGGTNLFQLGVAYEILTGTDPNGSKQDADLIFDTGYLGGTGTSHFWLDPDPDKRTVPLPDHTADGLSVCMHELGHALGFSGWRDMKTGALSGTSQSNFDLLSSTDGSNFFFAGPTAVSVYGGPVPETYANLSHIANLAPRPGTDLADDLMHGVPTFIQARYYISDIDVAIMRDVGLPVPGSPAIQEVCNTAAMRAEEGLSSRAEGVKSRAIVLGPPPPFIE